MLPDGICWDQFRIVGWSSYCQFSLVSKWANILPWPGTLSWWTIRNDRPHLHKVTLVYIYYVISKQGDRNSARQIHIASVSFHLPNLLIRFCQLRAIVENTCSAVGPNLEPCSQEASLADTYPQVQIIVLYVSSELDFLGKHFLRKQYFSKEKYFVIYF